MTAITLGLVAFFNQPLFIALLAILCIEFVTGVYKAWKLGQLKSSKLDTVLMRGFNYTVVFALLQIMIGVAPMFLPVLQLMMLTVCAKEAISVLENLKAVNAASGEPNDVLDKLVSVLGVDAEQFADQAKKAPVVVPEVSNNG